MHEPGKHTPSSPQARELARQTSGDFTHIIFTMERRCVECGEPTVEDAKVKRVAYTIETVSRPRMVELDAAARKLAHILSKKWRPDADWMPLKGTYSALSPLPAWQVEPLLHDLCRTGTIELKLDGQAGNPTHYRVTQLPELVDIARPGLRERIAQAREQAREILGSTTSLDAERVRELLASPESSSWPPEALLAAAAVARHASHQRALPIRVVSTLLLGGRIQEVSASKGIERYAERLETFFENPLSELGLRPHEPLVTIGGTGTLHDSPPLNLADHRPFLSFPSTRLLRCKGVSFPTEGLVFIENRNVFEAACFGEIPDLGGSLLVFTGGMVGASQEWFARAAASANARSRCWFDLDGEGIIAARLVRDWTNSTCEPYRMHADEFDRALRTEPLVDTKLATAERLAKDNGFLSDLAARLVARKQWVEQEALLLDSTATE